MKRVLLVCLATIALLPAQLWGQLTAFQKGLAISPVPLDLRKANIVERILIGTGSYFVNGPGGCVGCHTEPPYLAGGDPVMGQPTKINVDGFLAGGAPFGPFVSRNITPDSSGKPAGLTFEQFEQVIRTGVDLHDAQFPTPFPSPLLQVMPWPESRHLTDFDLRSIYEYLKRVPSRP
jgi:hypothetical protein